MLNRLMVVRVDATPKIGVGHAVRQLALAEEWLRRGHRLVVAGDLVVPWVQDAWQQLGVPVVAADSDWLSWHPDVVVLDGYQLPSALGAGLQAVGVPVVAMVDGDFGRAQVADLFVDQNLGAAPVPGAESLVGLDYVLLRDQVLAARSLVGVESDPPRVLVVFGGTDPFAGCLAAGLAIAAAGRPASVTAIGATAEIRRQLAEIAMPDGIDLTVLSPTPDLPNLATSFDVAITAAGSSIWEFLAIGLPVGAVLVTENQRIGYDACVAAGLVLGLGSVVQLRDHPDSATEVLSVLLRDAGERERLRAEGRRLVDGKGKSRVVAAIEALIG